MFKNILIIILLTIVVIGGYTTRAKWLPDSATVATTTPEKVAEAEDAAVAEVPLSGRGSLAEIQKIGSNLECKIWMTDAGGKETLEGTTFISGSNIRGDFVSHVEGKEIVSSMIMTSEKLYTWSVIDGETFGVEKTLKPKATSEVTLDAREPVPLEAEVRYDCTLWRGVDRSVFAPPSNILFRDLELIMENGQEYGASFEGE